MKKLLLILFLLFGIITSISGEKICDIEEIIKYPQLKIDKNFFYILDNSTYNFYIYSRKTNKLIKKFGGKGEGPGEFKGNVSWAILHDSIFIGSTGKISYFTKQGMELKELPFNPNMSRLLAVEDRVVGVIWEQSKGKKIGDIVLKIVDPLTSFKFELRRIEPKNVLHFGDGMPKQDRLMIRSHSSIDSNGKIIALGNPEIGFGFKFYNKNGELINKFNYAYKKREVTTEIKKKHLENYKKKVGSRFEDHKKRFNFIFPKYFPPYYSIKLGKDRLYVFTHLTVNNDEERELYIMDLKGNLIKKTFVPRKTFSFFEDKYYYLVENDESEMTELHVREL